MGDNKNNMIILVAFILFLTVVTLFKTPNINISEPASEIGRYQFYPDRNIVFDTTEGALYQYEKSSDQKKLILLAEPQIVSYLEKVIQGDNGK